MTLLNALALFLGAVIGAAATIYVGKLASRTGKAANDWDRIQGLWGRVDALEQKVETLQGQNDAQGGQIESLQEQNRKHTDQIASLKKALAAARRYVSDLIALLRAHDLTPPDPPPDYQGGET